MPPTKFEGGRAIVSASSFSALRVAASMKQAVAGEM